MPPKQRTKAELKQQVDELTARLREAERRFDGDIEAERDEAQQRADEAERQLLESQQEVGELRVEKGHVVAERDQVSGQLVGVETDLVTEKDRGRQLERQLEDVRDEVDRLEWKLESAQTEVELQVARAREQALVDHRKELEARDELITLLKEKLQQQRGPKQVVELTSGSGCAPSTPEKVESGGRAGRMTLPSLSTFSGEESKDDGETFDRWVRRLEKHAELERWSEREKLLQLELRLKGRAERLFEVLSKESKGSFQAVVDGLRKRLAPVRREALVSAQLMKRKQKATETVDQYAQEFETLFDRSYGRREGMDQESKDLLKRDLFVLGLRMKWQEKVLPSSESFSDCLHQARAAEEQERQLNELHQPKGPEAARPSKAAEGSAQRRSEPAPQARLPEHPTPPVRSSRCWKCGSTRHQQRDCPQRQPPSETPWRGARTGSNAAVMAARAPGLAESLEERSHRLRNEWTETEFLRLAKSYQPSADVDAVSGSLGPLFYAKVDVAGTSVEAMVDPGSSATIMSFELFRKIGARAKIPVEALRRPDVVLRDYSQRPVPIGACVDLEFEWQGKSVTTTVYLRSDLGTQGEPCLLGTNVVIPLGLMVPGVGVEPRGGDSTVEGRTNPVVQLVQAKRVPGCSAMFLKARMDTELSGGAVVFEPSRSWLEDTGLHMEESVLTTDAQGYVHVLVQNPTANAKRISAGALVGKAEEFNGCEEVEDASVSVGGEQQVCSVEGCDGSEPDVVRKGILEKLVRVSGESLTAEEDQSIRNCVVGAHDVFALSELERGEVGEIEHKIDTGDSPPVCQPLRRVPFSVRPKIRGMVDDMLQAGVVQESKSPWASPVVLVKKKDGGLRFCVDYRALNAVTRKDVFPMPRIDDMLDQLGGKKIFSTLDARTGYWQICMDPSSREKTAFATHNGLYEFRVMPFGVCNGPATFQRLMQQTLRGLGDFCNVYIDDMIIFSSTVEDHVRHLRLVFDRLRAVGLKLHPAKCDFASPEVMYLGHMITADGILPNPGKVEAVRSFKNPTGVKEVREFLGLAGYYRRFVPSFAKVAGPLHSLTRQEIPFHWTSECQLSFDRLKELLSSPPVLAYPNFDLPFTLHTDASGKGLGAVLEQEASDGQLHPVAYASRTLSKHERNYGITELEALGVIWALRHFRAYLLGHSCVVVTDHAPLRALLKARHQSGKLARWSQTLAEFDLEIKYRPGRAHGNADALSRSPMELVGKVNQVTDGGDMAEQQRRDTKLKVVIEYIEQDVLPSDEKLARKVVLERSRFSLMDGVLYFVDGARGGNLRIVVPDTVKEKLMEEAHAGSLAGHFAARSLYNTLSRMYWWEGMYSDVHRFCRSCLTCASHGGTGRRHKAPLRPIPVSGPFDRVGVDILEMPQTERGNRYVIVFIDYLTKWVEAYATPDQTSETIARLLVDNVVCRHGVPGGLLSDRGANLLSSLIMDVCRLLGMRKINTTAYHPQGDGLVENFNRTLQAMLAKHGKEFGPAWDLHLQQMLFAYRVRPHSSTGESPFYLLYGRDPHLPTETAFSTPRTVYQVDVEDYRLELTHGLTTAWKLARQKIGKAQVRQKECYDRQAKEPRYKVGGRVMVFMPHDKTGKKRKMALPYHGPFRIVEVLPNGLSVRPVDRPQDEPILVNVDRTTKCPDELSDKSWLGSRGKRRQRARRRKPPRPTSSPSQQSRYELRSRTKT